MISMLSSEKLLLATQSLHVTTCQGKNGNLEPWYNTPHRTLAEFTYMMGEFGGDMWMTSYRTTPALRKLSLVYHPWRQQPQLFLTLNQLSHLKPAHIHLIPQLNWRQLLPLQVLCCVDHPALTDLLRD